MNAILVLVVLFLLVVLSEWLMKFIFFRNLGTALLVILLGAIVANLGMIPSASNSIPLYDDIFKYIAPLSIFYLLLEVNLANIRKAGIPMLLMFSLGAAGTVAGVFAGITLTPMQEVMGEHFGAVSGMFAGTYTGGSVNFNAVALHYEINKVGVLYAGSAAVDNIITTVWMLACIVLPKLLSRFRKSEVTGSAEVPELTLADQTGEEAINVLHLAILAALGLFSLWISETLAGMMDGLGYTVPSILLLTTFALILAQIPLTRKLKGSRLMGFISVYLFLAVIGAYCEISALQEIGRVGTTLLAFTLILVFVHGLVQFGIGSLVYKDWDLISISSQANIGGSTTALALAKSFNRKDLLLPAILAGSLGNGVGTYIGFLVAGFFS